MATVIGTIRDAGPITKPKRDGSTYTLNEVNIDGQVYVARKDVCNVAAGMLGQRVEAITRTEQKGDYTNHYLDFVQVAGGGTAPGQAEYAREQAAGALAPEQAAYQQTEAYNAALVAQEAALRAAQQAARAVTPPPQPPPPPPQQPLGESPLDFEARKNESIHRQVAAKVSAQISNTPQDFWANVYDLFLYFQSGHRPQLTGGVQPQVVAAQVVEEPRQNAAAYKPFDSGTNQFVPAAAYAAPDAPPPHGDDDIPF